MGFYLGGLYSYGILRYYLYIENYYYNNKMSLLLGKREVSLSKNHLHFVLNPI